jgi:hypothetical protein
MFFHCLSPSPQDQARPFTSFLFPKGPKLSRRLLHITGNESSFVQYDHTSQNIVPDRRNEGLFGKDAHLFNPDRWLHGAQTKKGPSIGVYGHLYGILGPLSTKLFSRQHLQIDVCGRHAIVHWLAICVSENAFQSGICFWKLKHRCAVC